MASLPPRPDELAGDADVRASAAAATTGSAPPATPPASGSEAMEAPSAEGVASGPAGGDPIGASPSSGTDVDSKAQQRLQRLQRQASDALRHAFSGHAKPARAQLEAVAQSAAKSDSLVTQGAALRASVCEDLLDLADSVRGMRDDLGSSGNTALWPRATEV